MESKILELFLYKEKIKFNEIVKTLKLRSNKVAYHLKKLVKEGILEKFQNEYSLSKTSEKLIPYLSNKKSPLPAILIRIGNKDKVFLCEREKRPFKGKLGLPGGRLLLGESISQAVKRIMKEKYSINAKFDRINSIALEHVKDKKLMVHSFILIFTEAKTKDKPHLTNIEENKKRIISSDYQLLKNNRYYKIKIKTLYSHD
ncbi:NUDIX domain-containing protein [Candidatus Pacearchaeota archaeon]|nr:NUDIX domain-containing protein [Candidatus Pacearchaeota archaeon]